MDNAQIAATLELFGNLLDLLGENAFKVRAYHAAARTLEGLERAVASLVREGKLKDVPGVGEGLAQKIEELLATGKIKQLEELKQKVPAGVLDLLRIPGCGPKRVRTLWEKLAIVDLALLKKACVEGKVAELPGFGERTQTKILQGIEFVASSSGRFRLDQVMPVARHVLEYVRGSKEVVRSHLAGSMRRWKEIVRNVDIVASTRNPEHVIDRFSRYEQVQSVLGKGPTKCSVQLVSGIQIDLRVVKEEEYFPALVYFTGSKDHNVLLRTRAQKMGLLVNEYGIFKGDKRLKVASEAELYQRLGLGMVPPELREAHGEIEAAESGVLPDLVELDDVVGMFHVHSTWSDGTAEIADMAEKCRKMGFKYMGLSDHSKAAAYAGGLTEDRLRKQMREVDELNNGWKDFRILKGLECDILPDGSMDMTSEILGKLDFVIGSVHSRFDMSEKEMTDRICKALTNKHLDILGHPTGRLLLSREPYKVDLERVLQEAKRARKVIELNANPHRLDLDWVHVKRAHDLGVMISIGPDAHSTQGIEDIVYGVATARRGWLSAGDILNTRTADEALEWLNHD